MKDKRLRISIASLVVFLVLAGLLHFVPISISFGQRHVGDFDSRNMSLQPGLYLVQVKKPMKLPDGMQPAPCSTMEAGFKHGDAPKNKPEVKSCNGAIKTLILNNGKMKYECTRCRKTWLQSSDGKIEGLP
ncbi:MAG TPA: hypothetical protein VMW72_05560 [Sedimentisphaerales bacterium]|nr:hypothetical protein [Sedimentisphaerales bacterium]